MRMRRLCVVLVASCALAALHWSPGSLPQGAGGIVGKAAGGSLAAGLNLLGATLLLLAAWMAGAAVAFGVSWFTVMDRHRGLDLGRCALGARALVHRREVNAGRRAKLERKEARAGRAKRAPRRASHRASRRRRRPRPRASAWKRSGRCRCSIRPQAQRAAAAGSAG